MIEGILSWSETHQTFLFWLAILSGLLFLGSILSLPFLATQIPQDYFSDAKRHQAQLKQSHPLIYLTIRLLKNFLGWLLILAGIVMLVLPGQGLLTILMGLVLSDFPGKFALERRLASNARIMGGINWLRERRGRPPLDTPFNQMGSGRTIT